MKKILLASTLLLFLSFAISSCKSSGPHCQAYGKIEKVKIDKSEKSI